MVNAVSTPSHVVSGRTEGVSRFLKRVAAKTPSLPEVIGTIISAVLLVLAFPNFNIGPLAWVALVPLFLIVVRRKERWRCFFLGWLFGAVFFYSSCYWLTYSMVHFGGIPAPVAFVLLVPGAVLLGIFPALFSLFLAHVTARWGTRAVLIAPLSWSALEWLRLEITGQLWNAIGYSQAFHPALIGSARWGGVYAVGAFLVFLNALITLVVLRRSGRDLAISATLGALIVLVAFITAPTKPAEQSRGKDEVAVVAIQPNVPMDLAKSDADMKLLIARHFDMSEAALDQLQNDDKPRLVIWPESPMNFEYGGDEQLRLRLAEFARRNNVSILLNSQEVAPNDGIYNSAVLINEQGKLIAQYDKIRLLPFGEYVPLPDWVPGSGLIRAIVGDFTAGTNYQLMPVGNLRAGVFICIESAYPSIARRFTNEGADVLINISNDGYLGPTAVMRQHLANAVFRAVENGRPLLSVTNTGITAFITAQGEVREPTSGFKPELRIWRVSGPLQTATFYAKHGDVFVVSCTVLSLLVLVFTFVGSGRRQDKF